jgi:hypothetical protein
VLGVYPSQLMVRMLRSIEPERDAEQGQVPLVTRHTPASRFRHELVACSV